MDALQLWLCGSHQRSQMLASQVGVTAEAVRLWAVGKRKVGVKKIMRVSEVTGLSPSEIRPDVFGPEQKREQAA